MSFGEEEACIQVTKERSLRSIPPVYAPSFFISHGKNAQNQSFCIPSDGSYHVRSVPEMRGRVCSASCYGWLILEVLNSNHCHLFNPVTLNTIQLPEVPLKTIDHIALTCPPTLPECVIMFFSKDENVFVFCRVGDENWIKQTTSYDRFSSAVSSNGKIYLLSHQVFTRIDLQGNLACIVPFKIQEPKGYTSPTSTFRMYFLDSHGEIFRLYQIFLGSSRIVRKFSVCKLDLSEMAWEHVQSLGDRIFLLDSGSSSGSVLTAAEFGAQGNCIYFFAQGRTDLCRFNMEDGTIMVTQPCPPIFPKWAGPFWLVPNCNLQAKNEKAEVIGEMQGCDSILPPELLQIVSQSLNLGGIIRFRVACKASISMTPPVRCLTLKVLFDSHHLPWLISVPNTTKKTWQFHHPIYTDGYTVKIPGATVHSAKFGWLLMSVDSHVSLFFFNPITKETINIPKEPEQNPFPFRNLSFSSPPTSSDCVVFGLKCSGGNSVQMSSYNKAKNRWSPCFLRDLPYSFVPSCCNPVFHDGVFYCLSKDGKLGVFDPNETSRENMWRVYTSLSVQDVRSTSVESVLVDSTRSFILENNGDIFSVFVGFVGSPVRVYKLDQSKKKMEWLKVQTLDNRVMFLSHTTSLLIPAVLKGTENRIYFPRFKKNACVFYSPLSGKYHSFGEQESRVDWIDTCEHWNCTWFQITK